MVLSEDRTLAQRLSKVFHLFGLLVTGAFFLTVLAGSIAWVWIRPETERIRLAVKAEGEAQVAMLDEEVGLRGYLLTRDVRFIDPYTRGLADLARANDTLVQQVRTRELGALMIGTRVAEERWQQGWANAAADTAPNATPPSMVEGKALFDAYRAEETACGDARLA